MLEIKNISFSYTKTPFINNLSCNIHKGELVSILGANGSGKSTLLQIISGFLKPEHGEILYNGKSLSLIPQTERAKEIACIYQSTSCKFPFTCYEIAEMGLYPHKKKAAAEDRDEILHIMEKTDTYKFKDKLITELSGGETQRVLLAKALVQRPKLLLLDEAMSGFDIAVRLKMLELLREIIKEKNISVIFVRHDIDAAFSGSDRILAMKNGRLLYNNKPQSLLTEEFFAEIFGVRAEINNDRFYIK